MRRVWRRSTVAALVSLFVISGLVVADEAPTASEDVEASADDVRQDAVEYSATFGVSVDEARRRLELQPALGSLIHEMEGLAPTRFAGGWIEHEPEYRVVVRYTGEDVGLAQAFALARSAPVLVIVETGARFSLSQLLDGLGRISKALDTELPDIASEVDVHAGGLLLTSPTLIPARTIAELQAAAGVPIKVERGPQVENHHTYGGRKLTVSGNPECTTGFTVHNLDTGVRGVVTAGHCANAPTYWQDGTTNYPLTLMGVRDNPDQDAQWMDNTGHAEFDDFWDGDSFRDVVSTIPRRNALGDFVCHYGIGSAQSEPIPGYSCGTVTNINFDPGDICGTPDGPCNSVWVKVEGANLACFGGDSGGPWFTGNAAYGIHNAGAVTGPNKGECSIAVFMSQSWLANMTLAINTKTLAINTN